MPSCIFGATGFICEVMEIRYKLYDDARPELTPLQQVLSNRGIPVECQQEWLSAGWESINDWGLLDDDFKLSRGVNMVKGCVERRDNICVVVDSDADGFDSAALLVNYLYKTYPEYAKSCISWILHRGKQHGLADLVDDILKIPSVGLVISPDGASNDREEQQRLNDAGINVLVLDHHECCDDYSTISQVASKGSTIVVNVQISDYPNKALTGAGVVWQFCRAYDELYPDAPDHLPHANDFLDLAATGDAGDMADYIEPEIRALMNLGLPQYKNPFLYALAQKNKYTLDKRKGMNYLSIAFGIVPFINAICRSGTIQEKEMVFEAMLLQCAFEKVESSKRGEKGVMVPLYQEAVTIADRVKRRQADLEQGAMVSIEEQIKDQKLTKNAIVAVVVDPSVCEAEIVGLAANKVQAKYQHPAMVLRRTKPADSDEEIYSGSLRNYSLCEVKNMKDVCESTGDTVFVAGHQAAAGIAIAASRFDDFIAKTNELYKDVDFTPAYMVDYIWNERTVDPNAILAIGDFNVYGQNVPECLVAVEHVPVSAANVTLLGLAKGHPTLKIQCGNISIMKFGSSEEEYERFIKPNSYLTLVGKCEVNRWMDNVSPQILIEDFELKQEWRF